MKTRTKVGVAAAAAALALGVGVGPASATTEYGHTKNIVINNATDWTHRVVWNTAFNSVGTSSTEPDSIQVKRNSNSGLQKRAATVNVIFKPRNGSAVYNDVVSCPAPTGTGYSTCPLPGMPNVLLSAQPEVLIIYFDSAGNVVGSDSQYLYL